MLSDAQRELRDRARRFATETVAPAAARIDRSEAVDDDILARLRDEGFLNGAVPAELGGGGMDPLAYGLVTEEIGRACSSVRSLMTVHNMVLQTLARFGTPEQKSRWLPELVTGGRIAAFALTEPEAGSVASAISCRAEPQGDHYRLAGRKSWISFGQRADVFLVIARVLDRPGAFLVPCDTPGMSVRARRGMLGARGAMLADLHFDGVEVPGDHLVGEVGAGLSFVASAALDHGRFSVAWGTLGTLRACLEDCLDYAERRKIGNSYQRDLPLVQQSLTEMWLGYETSQALCRKAARLRAKGNAEAPVATSAAKYYAAREALSAATAAVRLHGANGCSPDYPVNRHLRDATIAGIIEGAQETHALSLSRHAFQRTFLD
jgi:alkylation response protein AidB-like acyl-CoA dehydrogenase